MPMEFQPFVVAEQEVGDNAGGEELAKEDNKFEKEKKEAAEAKEFGKAQEVISTTSSPADLHDSWPACAEYIKGCAWCGFLQGRVDTPNRRVQIQEVQAIIKPLEKNFTKPAAVEVIKLLEEKEKPLLEAKKFEEAGVVQDAIRVRVFSLACVG